MAFLGDFMGMEMDAKTTDSNQPGGLVSAAEMKTWEEWAKKGPGLIRETIATMPDKRDDTPRAYPRFRAPLIGLGVVASALSFTKIFPGKSKWLGGALGVGAIGAGLYSGMVANEMNARIDAAAKEDVAHAKRTFSKFADVLEKDPVLQKHMAEYLSQNMSAKDVEEQSMEMAVLRKLVAFAEKSPYLKAAKDSGMGR